MNNRHLGGSDEACVRKDRVCFQHLLCITLQLMQIETER
jgi:hypothetical protein